MTRLRGEGPRETTISQASQPWSADELAETRYWCDKLEDRSPQTNANRRWLATYDECQRELREFEHMELRICDVMDELEGMAPPESERGDHGMTTDVFNRIRRIIANAGGQH